MIAAMIPILALTRLAGQVLAFGVALGGLDLREVFEIGARGGFEITDKSVCHMFSILGISQKARFLRRSAQSRMPCRGPDSVLGGGEISSLYCLCHPGKLDKFSTSFQN